jgi:Ca2+-binding EF-hand superfamily protein
MTYIIKNGEQDSQMEELRQAFIAFDESGDGQLQLEEIQKGLK